MPLSSSSSSRQCFVCSGAPKPSCYRKGHVTLCPLCKKIYSGGRDECPHCNPPADKFRPTMVIKDSAASAPAPAPSQLKVTAKMVSADGPDRMMNMDEAKAQAAEPLSPVDEAAEESSVEEEEEQKSLTDDESVHDDSEHDDSESADEDSAVATPVDTAPAEVLEEAPAQKTFEEKLAGLTLEIPDRETEAEQDLNGEEVEVFPDTPEDAVLETEKPSMELKKPREESEKVVRKPVPASALPVKNQGKSAKQAAAHRCQTPDIPSCRRCSIHGKPATQTPEKKADVRRTSLTKTKTKPVRGQRRIKEDAVEESSEALGECF